MEKYLLISILLIAIAILFLNINGYIKKISVVDRMTEKISAEDLVISQCFSEDVLTLYFDIMQNREKYFVSSHTLKKNGLDIMVWASNDIENRMFYTDEKELKNKVEEMNSKLTYYDKVLLDNIIKAISDMNKRIITKIFI